MTDAQVLRKAAEILRQRSSKPRSLALDVLCRLLTNAADKAEIDSLR